MELPGSQDGVTADPTSNDLARNAEAAGSTAGKGNDDFRAVFNPAGAAMIACMVVSTILHTFIFWRTQDDVLYRTSLGLSLTALGLATVARFDIGAGLNRPIEPASPWIKKHVEKTFDTTFLVASTIFLWESYQKRNIINQVLRIPQYTMPAPFQVFLVGFATVEYLVYSGCLAYCLEMLVNIPVAYCYTSFKKSATPSDETGDPVRVVSWTDGLFISMYSYGVLAAIHLLSPERIVIRLALKFLKLDLENWRQREPTPPQTPDPAPDIPLQPPAPPPPPAPPSSPASSRRLHARLEAAASETPTTISPRSSRPPETPGRAARAQGLFPAGVTTPNRRRDATIIQTYPTTPPSTAAGVTTPLRRREATRIPTYATTPPSTSSTSHGIAKRSLKDDMKR